MRIAGYRFVDRFRVGFADVDMLRHANNLAYLRWAEQSRTDYLADVLGETILGARGMILAKMTIDYRLALAYREYAAIGTRVGRLGTKSFVIEHEIWSEDRAQCAAVIASTLVAYDYEAAQTIAIPHAWRTIVETFEAGGDDAGGTGPGAS